MIFPVLLFVLTCFALIVQDFMPTIPWAYYSFLYLVPVVFFGSAISVPYPLMLLLAFFTGFIWDFKNLSLLTDGNLASTFEEMEVHMPKVGTTIGFSIFLYGLLGSFMQGVRPLFRRGRWELPVLMTGLCVLLLQLLEMLWVNFRRGGFVFSREAWYSILTTSLLSMFVAPFVFVLIDWMARICGYQIRYEGLANRRWQS